MPGTAADSAPITKGALEGVRIAEFGLAWAGPLGTMLLSSFGAEVVKVETRTRPDFSRRVYGGTDLDMAPNFQDVNINKLSVSLDLKTPRGLELAKDLIRKSDVLMTNMRPGVMDDLGLGYEAVSAIRPDIIYLASSANGGGGRESKYAGWAPTFAALAGIADVTGFEDQLPVPVSMPTDIRCGYAVALAIVLALNDRRRTGRGQHVDLSSTEAVASLMPHLFVDCAVNGRVAQRLGNRDPWEAPQGCYPCKDDETWLSISVHNGEEWQQLARAVGHEEWLDDPRFADAAARNRFHAELDALITGWTRTRPVAEAMRLLQEDGVAAVQVFSPADLWTDRHTQEREVYTWVEHPKIGPRVVLNMPWKLSRTPARITRSGPMLGEHTDAVLGGLLGLSGEEIQRLKDDRVAY